MGRDHSIVCERCGSSYGGFNGPDECATCAADVFTEAEWDVDPQRVFVHAKSTGRAVVQRTDGSTLCTLTIPKDALECDDFECSSIRDGVRALHDMVDQTDPDDAIGAALTRAGLERRP